MADSPNKNVNDSQMEPKIKEEPKNNANKSKAVKTSRIYLATVAASLSAFAIGTGFAWSSPIGPKLTAQDTSDSPLDRPLTPNEIGWISSIFSIGALTTSLISGPMSDKIGRKKVLLLSSLFFMLSYIILMFAKEFWVLMVGRLTIGFGSGLALCIIPVYVGEISTDQLRGATVSLMPFLMSLGNIYCFAIGPYVSYMVLQYFCLLVPIVFDIAFIFMPESPYYFVAKQQRAAASKSLQFMRGQDEQLVEAELMSIENLVTTSMAQKAGMLEIVKTPGSRRALIITLGLTFLQQITGYSVATFYAQTIYESARIELDAAIGAILTGVVQLISAGIAPFVVNRFGRRTILINSAVFMGISQAALGYFFFALVVLENTNGITWLPVVALAVCNTAFMLGFGPVPWAVLSEVFPPSTKAFAATLNTSVNWIAGFLTVLLYPTLDAMGTYYAFWMFAVFCVIAFFFVLLLVPETKGLSFAEIQRKLNKNL